MKTSTQIIQDDGDWSTRPDTFVKRKRMFAIVWLRTVLAAISRAKIARAQNVEPNAVKIATISLNTFTLKGATNTKTFAIHMFSLETPKLRTTEITSKNILLSIWGE